MLVTYSTYSIENNLYCSWWEMCGTQQDMDGQAQAMKNSEQPEKCFERYHALQEYKLRQKQNSVQCIMLYLVHISWNNCKIY